MRLFKHTRTEGPPCRHMVGLLNGTADGSLHGLRRLYALAHAARCGPCRRFLDGLQAMISSLRASKNEEPGAETLERLRAHARAASDKE